MSEEVKLQILLVGNSAKFGELKIKLDEHPSIAKVSSVDNSHHGWGEIRDGLINTIIIDPFNLRGGSYDFESGILEATTFIFHVRQEFPSIAFAIYSEEEDWIENKDKLFDLNKGKVGFLRPEEIEIYKREKTRLSHYFRIIKSNNTEYFVMQINYAITNCLEWHRRIYSHWEHNKKYIYDVALSFAGEDRIIADELARNLINRGIRVFYDKNEAALLWGKNLYEYLHEIYSAKSRYCIVIITKNYKEKMWTNHERRAAQERALMERGDEYILPIRVEEIELPGLSKTVAYLHYSLGMDKIAELFEKKLIS